MLSKLTLSEIKNIMAKSDWCVISSYCHTSDFIKEIIIYLIDKNLEENQILDILNITNLNDIQKTNLIELCIPYIFDKYDYKKYFHIFNDYFDSTLYDRLFGINGKEIEMKITNFIYDIKESNNISQIIKILTDSYGTNMSYSNAIKNIFIISKEI